MTYQKKLDELIHDIKYELAGGVHTYHQCPYCKNHSTRKGKCALCLLNDFMAKLNKNKAKAEEDFYSYFTKFLENEGFVSVKKKEFYAVIEAAESLQAENEKLKLRLEEFEL